MEFDKVISNLGYTVKEKNGNYIAIGFEDRPSDIIIRFDLSNKLIRGALLTKEPIDDIDLMTHQYALFQKMQSDLKFFVKKSGYRRI